MDGGTGAVPRHQYTGSRTLPMQSSSDHLTTRLREVRLEKFGEEGVANLSQAMKIPVRTWEHFETGVMIPGWILLQFIEITGVDPHWLLTGDGERYRIPPAQSSRRTSR
jgi:hypothetical protein